MKKHLFVFSLMAGLTLLTTTLATTNLGGLNFPAALIIAGLQASLAIFYFMRVHQAEMLVKIFAVGGLLWICIMFGLTFNDYISRHWISNPSIWQSQ